MDVCIMVLNGLDVFISIDVLVWLIDRWNNLLKYNFEAERVKRDKGSTNQDPIS